MVITYNLERPSLLIWTENTKSDDPLYDEFRWLLLFLPKEDHFEAETYTFH